MSSDIFIEKSSATRLLNHHLTKREVRAENFYRECVSSLKGGCDYDEFKELCFPDGDNTSIRNICISRIQTDEVKGGKSCRDHSKAKEGYDELILYKLEGKKESEIEKFKIYKTEYSSVKARRNQNYICGKPDPDDQKPILPTTKPEDDNNDKNEQKCILGYVGDTDKGCQISSKLAISFVVLCVLFILVSIFCCFYKYRRNRKKLEKSELVNKQLRHDMTLNRQSSNHPLISPTQFIQKYKS